MVYFVSYPAIPQPPLPPHTSNITYDNGDHDIETELPPCCRTVFEYVIYTYVMTCVAALGVVVNVIIFGVFSHHSFRRSGGYPVLLYLFLITVADCMYNVAIFPTTLVRCTAMTSLRINHMMQRYFCVPIANVGSTASVWLTVAATLERVIYVSDSSQVKVICRPRSARICASAIYIAAVVINTAKVLEVEIDNNGDVHQTAFGNSLSFEIYAWFRFFVVKLIPILAVLFLNIALLRSIWVTKSRCRALLMQLPASAKRLRAQNRITAMLLSISFVFVVCHCLEPFVHFSIYGTLFGEEAVYKDTYANLRALANMLEGISHSTNVFSFLAFSSRFRARVAVLVKCGDCRRNTIHPVHQVKKNPMVDHPDDAQEVPIPSINVICPTPSHVIPFRDEHVENSSSF